VWGRTLIQNDHEGIAMAPGYNHGTVYVSTVPANVTAVYGAGGQGILWALNARTGAPEWSWNQDQNLWGNPGVNSGAGLWYTPSFDAQGDIYLGIANPAPIFGTKSYPLGSSRPGPNLYTDSDRRRQGRRHDRTGRADGQAAVAAPGGRAQRA
jgi:alcohol dehydrogenase (cytochrome c)